ncbi:MAG: hypothetical protein KMY54_08055, partial [Erysipelothrix sp.]|nr:hypothetical protein [Erysipelothrix sp.]
PLFEIMIFNMILKSEAEFPVNALVSQLFSDIIKSALMIIQDIDPFLGNSASVLRIILKIMISNSGQSRSYDRLWVPEN